MSLPSCVRHVSSWRRQSLLEIETLVSELTFEALHVGGTTRMVAGMGDVSYSYSGIIHTPAPWHPLVDAIRLDVEKDVGHSFNHCVANLYRDGLDCIEWHADDQPELGNDPTIATVSFGASRMFNLRSTTAPHRYHWVLLATGDLLVMSGECQRVYQHSVSPAPHADRRLSLTFRQISDRHRIEAP